MTRNGTPIEDYPITGGVNTGIRYSGSYEQYDACVAHNLDPWLWETGHYPKWFMVKIMARHRLKNLIDSNQQDAVAKATKKKGKKR